jgi:RhoGEF domain/SOS1/NGEF-like PH domain
MDNVHSGVVKNQLSTILTFSNQLFESFASPSKRLDSASYQQHRSLIYKTSELLATQLAHVLRQILDISGLAEMNAAQRQLYTSASNFRASCTQFVNTLPADNSAYFDSRALEPLLRAVHSGAATLLQLATTFLPAPPSQVQVEHNNNSSGQRGQSVGSSTPISQLSSSPMTNNSVGSQLSSSPMASFALSSSPMVGSVGSQLSSSHLSATAAIGSFSSPSLSAQGASLSSSALAVGSSNLSLSAGQTSPGGQQSRLSSSPLALGSSNLSLSAAQTSAGGQQSRLSLTLGSASSSSSVQHERLSPRQTSVSVTDKLAKLVDATRQHVEQLCAAARRQDRAGFVASAKLCAGELQRLRDMATRLKLSDCEASMRVASGRILQAGKAALLAPSSADAAAELQAAEQATLASATAFLDAVKAKYAATARSSRRISHNRSASTGSARMRLAAIKSSTTPGAIAPGVPALSTSFGSASTLAGDIGKLPQLSPRRRRPQPTIAVAASSSSSASPLSREAASSSATSTDVVDDAIAALTSNTDTDWSLRDDDDDDDDDATFDFEADDNDSDDGFAWRAKANRLLALHLAVTLDNADFADSATLGVLSERNRMALVWLQRAFRGRRWRRLIADYGESRMSRRQRKRFQVIMELLNTERTYASDLLNFVLDFYEPLRTLDILSHDELTNVFLNIKDIARLQSNLLARMEARWQEWPANGQWGDVILQFSDDMLRDYAPYLKSHHERVATLQRLCAKHKGFSRYCSARDSRKRATKSVDSYMIMPAQRLPRYELLIAELLSLTPEQHLDHHNLHVALKKIRELTEDIDRQTRARDQLASIQTMLAGAPTLVSPHRFLVRQGPLSVAHPSKKKKRIERYCFSFNDIFVVTNAFGKQKRDGTRYSFVEMLPLADVRIIDIIDRRTFCTTIHSFKIVCSESQQLVLFAPDVETKQPWLDDLSGCSSYPVSREYIDDGHAKGVARN